jgi:antitoxin MazE
MGNSLGVLIPKPLLAELGAKADDPVKFGWRTEELSFRRSARSRFGWAEASKRLAAAADGGLVWPEFGSDADQDLKG